MSEGVDSQPRIECVQLMEQAMRAMDEFIQEPTQINTVYYPPATQLRRAADAIERKEKALKLWEEVKTKCWGKAGAP